MRLTVDMSGVETDEELTVNDYGHSYVTPSNVASARRLLKFAKERAESKGQEVRKGVQVRIRIPLLVALLVAAALGAAYLAHPVQLRAHEGDGLTQADRTARKQVESIALPVPTELIDYVRKQKQSDHVLQQAAIGNVTSQLLMMQTSRRQRNIMCGWHRDDPTTDRDTLTAFDKATHASERGFSERDVYTTFVLILAGC
jgi:hypothetical protein